jgi:hypothetical protein
VSNSLAALSAEQGDLRVDFLQLVLQQTLLGGQGGDVEVDLVDLAQITLDVGHLGLLVTAEKDVLAAAELDDGVFGLVQLALEQGDLLVQKAIGAVAFLPLGREILLDVGADQGVDVIPGEDRVGVDERNDEQVALALHQKLCTPLQKGNVILLLAIACQWRSTVDLVQDAAYQLTTEQGILQDPNTVVHIRSDSQALDQAVDDILFDENRAVGPIFSRDEIAETNHRRSDQKRYDNNEFLAAVNHLENFEQFIFILIH